MKLKRFCNFLVREGQSSKPLWLKAKVLIQKVSFTLGSTLLSRPICLLISWLGSSFVSKYWVFWFGLEVLHILNARHRWPFGQDICNIIWKRGNLSFFLFSKNWAAFQMMSQRSCHDGHSLPRLASCQFTFTLLRLCFKGKPTGKCGFDTYCRTCSF